MRPRVLVTSSAMQQVLPGMLALQQKYPAEFVLAPMEPGADPSLLLRDLPTCDGWIAGTEEINAAVLKAGHDGRLRALVRWGVGMDNVDQAAAAALGVTVDRTAGVFADEVADLGVGYLLALARDIVRVDRAVRRGEWIQRPGASLRGKTAAVVGYGSIGQNLVQKLGALGMNRLVYSRHLDGVAASNAEAAVQFRHWPDGLEEADYLLLVSALTAHNRGLVSAEVLGRCKPSACLINLGRGALVDETALAAALAAGRLAGAALDVFLEEPLPMNSPLRQMENVILGTHNASNTREGALRATEMAVELLFRHLENR